MTCNGSASLGKFKLRLGLLADIDALGPTGEWLDGVPPGKIAHFAGEACVTDVADLRKIQDEGKRLTLVASLVHVVRAGVRDDVVTMFCKRMAAINKKGRDHLEALREAHRAESERLLGVLGDVLSAVLPFPAAVLAPGDQGRRTVPVALVGPLGELGVDPGGVPEGRGRSRRGDGAHARSRRRCRPARTRGRILSARQSALPSSLMTSHVGAVRSSHAR